MVGRRRYGWSEPALFAVESGAVDAAARATGQQAPLQMQGGAVNMRSMNQPVVDPKDVPHGDCVDCGRATWLWCEHVGSWHCTV